jgi:hypothetical protein
VSDTTTDAVKRYRWIECYVGIGGDASMCQATMFVRASDYDALEKQVAELRAANEKCIDEAERMFVDMHAKLTARVSERDALKADNDRLREALILAEERIRDWTEACDYRAEPDLRRAVAIINKALAVKP